ncbi:hypothetical protein [Sporosarcina sp. A2]|uniref:hypothetical protein n=1 Tax=Sporosarcina sp. A2 TaxID=3393449 RepID=UPI003D79D90F
MKELTETEKLINLLIITTGSYKATGYQEKRLENDFVRYLKLLQIETNTTEEGAMQLLMNSQEVLAA